MNLAVWLARHAQLRPQAPALAAGERVHVRWAEFAARAAAAAAGLRDPFGLSAGDRVAIIMRNRPEYVEALCAIWHAGLVAVPVNARLHRDKIAYVLEHSETAVVVTDPDHADDVEPLVGDVASLQAVVVAPGKQWDRITASAPVAIVDPAPGVTWKPGCGQRPLVTCPRRQSPVKLALYLPNVRDEVTVKELEDFRVGRCASGWPRGRSRCGSR